MVSRINYNNPRVDGSFCIPYHYEMLADKKRVNVFKRVIDEVCKGKRVLDVGTGTGIFSIMAANSGASQVFAVEVDSVIARIAAKNIGCSGHMNITLLEKSIFAVRIGDMGYQPVDVVISENLSTWLVTEDQIAMMNYINTELIHPTGIRVPQLVLNYVEMAESKFTFEESVQLVTHYFQFSGVEEPKMLSDKQLFQEIDLCKSNSNLAEGYIELTALDYGIANSLRLSSVAKLYSNITFSGSDSLFPPVVVPLKTPLPVFPGKKIKIGIRYNFHSIWEGFNCWIEE